MRKFLMMLTAASVMMVAASCDDEKTIAADKLPQPAKDFIETHFADATITRVIKDTEGSTEYDVRLDNGFELEFNKSGNWRDVDGKGMELPASFAAELPEGITTYTETNHGTQALSKVELNRSTYEVALTGGLEIIFSLQGEFVRYDD